MSEIKYSSRFKNLLNLIDHRVAKALLDLENKNFDVTQNYIDITDTKDSISFTPERKVQEIISKLPQLWLTTEETRHLTHGSANTNMFNDLGYTKPNCDPWSPGTGTTVVILGEAKSRISDKVYCIIQEFEDARQTVVNKATLETTTNYNKIWTTNRNNIRVGRFTRNLLTSAKINFTTKEIEEFTNQFKAAFDFNADASNKFDVVSGDDIAKWYHFEKYTQGGGSMNNSCMANVKKEFFDIYTKNPQVKLVILYDDNGKLENAKYTSDKIKGRAIVWNGATCLGVEGKIDFMDRIYTVQDSDTDLFKRYAESKGFWYKKGQNMDFECSITNGVIEQKAMITVELDETNFAFYPYTDTMSFTNLDDNTISNLPDDYHRKLRSTTGGYEDENENYFDPQDYDNDYDEENDD
jgi:hypothetical protein